MVQITRSILNVQLALVIDASGIVFWVTLEMWPICWRRSPHVAGCYLVVKRILRFYGSPNQWACHFESYVLMALGWGSPAGCPVLSEDDRVEWSQPYPLSSASWWRLRASWSQSSTWLWSMMIDIQRICICVLIFVPICVLRLSLVWSWFKLKDHSLLRLSSLFGLSSEYMPIAFASMLHLPVLSLG
jgi:hypothetical protein